MEERLYRYDQVVWDNPDLEKRRYREYRRLWGRYGVDIDDLRNGIKGKDPAARDIGKRYAGRVEAEVWVIQNAVTRGLTTTQMLRQLIESQMEAPCLDGKPEDIPEEYTYFSD